MSLNILPSRQQRKLRPPRRLHWYLLVVLLAAGFPVGVIWQFLAPCAERRRTARPLPPPGIPGPGAGGASLAPPQGSLWIDLDVLKAYVDPQLRYEPGAQAAYPSFRRSLSAGSVTADGLWKQPGLRISFPVAEHEGRWCAPAGVLAQAYPVTFSATAAGRVIMDLVELELEMAMMPERVRLVSPPTHLWWSGVSGSWHGGLRV